MDLTPDQIARLQSLGIAASDKTTPSPNPTNFSPPKTTSVLSPQPQPLLNPAPLTPPSPSQTSSPPPQTPPPISEKPIQTNQIQTNNIKKTQSSSLTTDQNQVQTISSSQEVPLLIDINSPENTNKSNIIPLLSISGFTLLSLTSLILFKSQDSQTTSASTPPTQNIGSSEITPTQVPKSIQHYLLTSQQYFSQALTTQNQDQNQTLNHLNQSILLATSAINEFPDDFRGYEQRGRIYQSLTGSQPQLIDQAIADFTSALRFNPNSSDLNRHLAALFAQKGDKDRTLFYLAQTVALEPTKADNFYDLARVQQQAGLIPQALNTYNQLLSLITDPFQQNKIKAEKLSLEKLVEQSGTTSASASYLSPTLAPLPSLSLPESPTLQAENISDSSGPIIAAPEEIKTIQVTGQSDSNALSGNATLPSGQTQIAFSNEKLTSASQVYLSVISGPKNINLQLLSKSAASFTVGVDSPASQDIEFKWWIINP